MANRNALDNAFLHTGDWGKIRKVQLMRQPLCARCEASGVVTPATQVDHVKVPHGDTTLQRDPANLMSLCASCHGAKTRHQGKPGKPRRRVLYTGRDGWPVFIE